MRSHRKHIDGLDFLCLVAERFEDGEVAREARGIARNVDDALGVHIGKRLEDRFRAAGARRVDDDDIGAHALFVEARHDFRRVADNEFGIAHVVVAGVFLRVEDGRLDDFDAVDLMRFLREEQRNRTRAAVGVDDRLFALEVGKFEGLVVEHFGLRRIDLEERTRRDMERQAADAVEDGRLAPEQLRLAAHDDIVAVRLDVLMHADDMGQAPAQGLDEFLFARQLLRRRDDDDHELALPADAADDMAHDARVFVFIIYGNAQFGDDIAHSIDDFVVAFLLDMAVARIDDFMAALCKAADDGFALLAADRKLHLIAVIPRICGTERRLDENVLLPADTRDGIDDLLALRLELGHIVEVLELAAAALIVDGADWLHTVSTLFEDFRQAGLGVRLLDLRNHGPDFLPRQSIGHEDRKVLITPYTFAARAKCVNFDFV